MKSSFKGKEERSEAKPGMVDVSDRDPVYDLTVGFEAAHIGSKCNQWQKPVTRYGSKDSEWCAHLARSPYVGEMDFGRQEWARARDAVDGVLRHLLEEMNTRAKAKYKGLRIDKFVLQGSSRDGLKVIAPNEFDIGFEFWIEGISFVECPLMRSNKRIPGFCYLKVNQSVTKLEKKCPELLKKNVFQQWENGDMYLSSKKLHQAVFQSLIDQSCKAVEMEIQKDHSANFTITRKMNPPAVNITLHLDDDAYGAFMPQGSIKSSVSTRDIDVDVIPALRLQTDSHSSYHGEKVQAAIHVICKWKEDESEKALEVANQNFVWLINSVAYERHIFDVARGEEKEQYILTALRVLKTYCTKAKTSFKSRGIAPPPITVLQSYHLKQITCYMIMYTCYLYPATAICGTHEALEYLLAFLYICLEKGKLPHFFYSNSMIIRMFKDYPYTDDAMALRYNLFRKIKGDALLQAKHSLQQHVAKDLDTDFRGKLGIALSESFSSEICRGEYF